MRTFTTSTTNISFDKSHSISALQTPYRLTNLHSCKNVVKAAPIAFPKLYEGGLWLELIHPGPMQAFEASINDEGGKVKVQRQFVITNGSNTFFWRFDNAHWPGGIYTLLMRDKFCQYEWMLLL